MECNGMDSRSNQGLLQSGYDKEIGLEFDVECAIKKPRVEKMDVEKLGKKKRSAEIKTGFHSDDDEPIGSMFKLKSRRNPKKVKVEEDGGGGKVKKTEVECSKDEELGGMDDTLASFRKKLKAPKKESKVGMITERDSCIDLKEPLDQSSNGAVKDESLTAKSLSKTVKKEQVTRDREDGIDESVKKGSKTSGKEKNKRSKSKSAKKKALGGIEFDKGLDGQGSGENLTQNEREGTLGLEGGSGTTCFDNQEDLLSAFFRKAQSGLLRKSRSSSISNHPFAGITKMAGEGSEIKIDEEQMQPASPIHDCVPTGGGFIDSLDKQYNIVLTSPKLATDQKISDVLAKYNKGLSHGNDLSKSGEAIYSDSIKQISTEALDPSISPSQNSLAHNGSMKESLKSADGLVVLDECQNDLLNAHPHSSSSGIQPPQKEVTSSDCDSLNQTRGTCTKEPDIATVSSQKEDASVSDGRLSPVSLGRDNKYDLVFRANRLGKSSELADEEAPSVAPDQNEAYASDTGSMPDFQRKDDKQSAEKCGKRIVRQAKRYRHVDMAYEGDADWEVLIHEQNFLVSHHDGDKEQTFKTKEKLDFLSTMALEAESGGAAAVSAGLKARAAGPVEKIKFKELLKHKGGLQEYIDCRNHILRLWSKDVTRILPLSECGVSDTAVVDEHPQASMVRDIYAFLDHYGYINFGVASKKMADAVVKHSFRISEEKNNDGKSGVPVTDSDGVTFIVGGVKSYDALIEEKDDTLLTDENREARTSSDSIVNNKKAQESSTVMECEGHSAGDFLENNGYGGKLPNNIVNPSILSSTPCTEVEEGQSASIDQRKASQGMQCDSEIGKRIIVIGAGPAGLTAARHLQRQGFHVTVLEARDRIGGRVFTDRSSLSVPVDLGASIITGVEADVATERRPDPSALICAQLGLELTVLNSDCPLYDTVTGNKVPTDLDESLEAEYNSLLDDMQLLVAQKGDHAMRMSLEDGLEYALKVRRTVHSRELLKSDHVIMGSEKPSSDEEILSPLERRVMDWHLAHLEYGCAASLKEVSLPYWNQDDEYGGFGGAHCMIKGGYSAVVDSLKEGLCIHLNHIVTDVSYHSEDHGRDDIRCNEVQVSTSNGREFTGDAVLITVPLGCLKAETIKFSPQLPQWKYSSIQRLGFGVLNKVVLEFPEVFWDDSVDYFGATAEETDQRGWCFMFWNVKKTVGAPVIIALVVGKSAISGQDRSSSDHVKHALVVLKKLFGEVAVPDPVASVVTDWGRDPFSFGAYSYVAIGASGEDYDTLGRPIKNCLFFAGEATCKEHPDTVGGAMMSGLREAVRIVDILTTGNDYTAEVEAMVAAQRRSDSEKGEVRDIIRRLDAIELTNVLYKNSLDASQTVTRVGLLQDLFNNAKTTSGRLHLAKELLKLPAEVLKSFAGTKEGLSVLNSWILDSMGKDGTQLLRHCVRLLVLVSTDLLAIRMSGIGKTVKEKVCVHTSRDIRAIASQLVSVWVEIFRQEKATNGGLKLLRQSSAANTSKSKSHLASGKPPLRAHHPSSEHRVVKSAGNHLPANANNRKGNTTAVTKSENKPSGSAGRQDCKKDDDKDFPMSEEEKAAFAAAEAARAAAIAAAEAYESSGAKCNTPLQLPKIPSFHKFARREQYAQMDDSEFRRKWSGGVMGRQDCISEIDSRNCRVRDWSVDFSAAGVNLDSSKKSVDNRSQRSHSNENACQLSYREHSGESAGVDSSLFTKAWVDSAGSEGIKDCNAIERWQSQAAAADSDFFHRTLHIMDEEDSNMNVKPSLPKPDGLANESSASHVTVNRELVGNQPRGVDNIKQAVVDYVASLLMPLYKARKIDKEGYKSIMKKTATKVMEQTTDAEKAMAVFEFLDFKRKNKIRAFVDRLIERHMATQPSVNS